MNKINTEKCITCRKSFIWFWRWRSYCTKCKRNICRKCITHDLRNSVVCSNCHVCTKCHSTTSIRYLTHILYDNLCPKCHNKYQDNIRQWIPGTKQEYVRGYNILNEIGIVEVFEDCNNAADVERLMKQKCALAGGNTYIRFFWDKRIDHHDEEYVAGYGRNGKPYYRTRHWTTQHFNGHATAVVATPKKM